MKPFFAYLRIRREDGSGSGTGNYEDSYLDALESLKKIIKNQIEFEVRCITDERYAELIGSHPIIEFDVGIEKVIA